MPWRSRVRLTKASRDALVERAEDDAELRERDGAEQLEPGLALPEGEVERGEDDRAGPRRDLAGERLGRGRRGGRSCGSAPSERKGAASESIAVSTSRRELSRAIRLRQARGRSGKRVVQVRAQDAAAARGQPEDQLAAGRRERAQDGLGREREQPA